MASLSEVSVTSRREKVKLMEKRRESSICVKLLRKKVEKGDIEAALSGLHQGIDKIYFPRQKLPRFFFVLCSSPKMKPAVSTMIKKLKNDKVGPLVPKDVLPPKPKPLKSEMGSSKTIDPLTLVLEMIPKELSTEKLKNEFPGCRKANRFYERRCYLYFKSLENAFQAFEKLKTEEVLGHKLSVRYRRITQSTKKGKKFQKDVEITDDTDTDSEADESIDDDRSADEEADTTSDEEAP